MIYHTYHTLSIDTLLTLPNPYTVVCSVKYKILMSLLKHHVVVALHI